MKARISGLLIAMLILVMPLSTGQSSPSGVDMADTPTPQTETLENVNITMLVANMLITQNSLGVRAQNVNMLLQQRGIPVDFDMNVYRWDQISAVNSDILLVMTDDYRRLAASGEFADLAEGLDARPQLKEINSPLVWGSASVGDAIYGIPLMHNYDELECAHHSGMYVRTDILDDLGLPVPETVDELIAASLMAKDAGFAYQIAYANTQPPYALHRTYEQWPFYVDADSLVMYDDKGNVSAYPGSDIYYYDADILSSMNDLDILCVHRSSDEQYVALTRKWDVLAAFCPAPPPSEEIPYVVLQFEPQRKNFNFNYAYGFLLAISESCADVELALDVLKCIYTEREVYDVFVYGQEDRDYTLDDEGRITMQTTSSFHEAFGQRALERENAASAMRPASYYVDEGTMIRTMPARLFLPSDTEARDRLLSSEAYGGEDGVLVMRIFPDDLLTITSAIDRLKDEGLSEYIVDCQVEYEGFFRSMYD